MPAAPAAAAAPVAAAPNTCSKLGLHSAGHLPLLLPIIAHSLGSTMPAASRDGSMEERMTPQNWSYRRRAARK